MPRPAKIYRILGQRIRRRRERCRFSQEKLAEKADVTRNYIGQIERAERKITLETLARIAKALGVRLKNLIDDL